MGTICATVPLYPPSSLVGAWISSHACLAHLAGLGHQVDVYTYFADETYDLDGVHVHPRRVMPTPADIVISHLGDKQQGVQLARWWDVPSVRMVHSIVRGARAKLDEAPGTTLAVFNSEATLAEAGWDGPSIVVHPPVRSADYATTPGDHVTLINLSREKGGVLFRQLAHELEDVSFLGVRGHYGAQVEAAGPNVTIIDTTEQMRSVYARTSVLLMPSQRESWGRVGVEAMCSGIPVIAHPTPGLVEALGPGGIFVHRMDREGWVAQIRRLTDPDEWAEASAAATARAAELDPDRDLARFAEAIESLMVPACV